MTASRSGESPAECPAGKSSPSMAARGLIPVLALCVGLSCVDYGTAPGSTPETPDDPSQPPPADSASDRAALTALYEATGGPDWENRTGWASAAPVSNWHGVRTNGAGRVLELSLRDNALTGPIPPELGNLTALQVLDLNGNALDGPIPPELGNLTALQRLFLRGNALTGPIPPELGNLTAAIVVLLDGNALEGPIPPELGRLAGLRNLGLSGNSLTGSIPPELGRLPRAMQFLALARNSLTGPIPPELGRLEGLYGLYLSGNALEGPMPSSLLGLDELLTFDFQDNMGLCAPGTADFAAWLEGIRLRSTGRGASGPFCNETDQAVLELLFRATSGGDWANATGWRGGPVLAEWHGIRADTLGRAVALDLAGNGLVGQLPERLGELAHVVELDVGDNPGLGGPLPISLADLSLSAFRYAGTELCVPANTAFREWLEGISSHQGTGMECPPPSGSE